MIQNQPVQSNRGGFRPGSGRPKGSKDKPRLSDRFTGEEKAAIVKKTLEKALEGDSKLLQFLVEQMYGKASQAVELEGGAEFVLKIAKEVADKHETALDTSDSSEG